jgi:hypothetical protein
MKEDTVEQLLETLEQSVELLHAYSAQSADLIEKYNKLWMLLDDIDTASDMFKPDHTNYYKYVTMKHEERFAVTTAPIGMPTHDEDGVMAHNVIPINSGK